MSQASALPGLALAPSALAVVLILLSRRRPVVRETWSILAAITQTVVLAAMIPSALGGTELVWSPIALAEGVPLVLRADPLGVFFGTLASALWVLTTVYSIGYTRALREHAQTRYFASFALSLFATIGVALAGNLVTFFGFFEILTVATYPLVIHKETPEAARAGRVYLAYTLTAGAALLGAVAGIQVLAGRTEFQAGGILGGLSVTPAALWGLLLLCVVGCGVKAALVPLHTWLPLAMIAPTPVSALLHAVAVVKAGVFGLARVTGFVFGPELLGEMGADHALAAVALATILLGSLAALRQDNLKRLLAFSTVSQLSYIVLGVTLGVPEAFAGGVLHIASHGLLKITLFFCAGALYVAAGAERVSELDGIGRRMPFTMAAFALAAFLLAGLPPGLAFASKWHLLAGAVGAHAWLAVATLSASTVLNIAYFAPIVIRAFRPGREGPIQEAPLPLLVPLLVTAAGGLLLGVDPDAGARLWSLAQAVAVSVGGVR
ncbi:MAG TPA: proton-conducting transporter membrane subunit [Methylomirabilota bacterium]|nr:proton-conducting transporter membrane subunit [Methylomirabilota bacterium]